LTYRSACLSRRQVVWTLLQPDYAHSGGDRTAGDNDALASATNKLRYLGGETRKLFCVEGVGARPSENAGAELEKNAPGFSGHTELLSKSENESAQKQFSPMMAPSPLRSRVRAREGSFTDVFYGLRILGCKTTQFCARPRKSEIAETPNVRNGAQAPENARKNSPLNYESPALTAELQARFACALKHSISG
jgi:hypothetical protein